MGHYISNLRDIEFNLFEIFGLGERLGAAPFTELDRSTARQVLRGVEELASGKFADSFTDGDRNPPALRGGDVRLPTKLIDALDAYFAGEWHRLPLPEHLGGYGAPPSLGWACTAMLAGANPAAMMYTAGPFFAAIIDHLVTEDQRARWVVPMAERNWGSTMVLTEPDAGSDVGEARTTAVDAGDGIWHLTGTKRFITNGDFDWPENILHLVLARAVGADGTPLNGPGTKGLSLFMVPKFWPNHDGSPGKRNGVAIARLEDKMGLKASATCELTFGHTDVPARGVLVGNAHDGIRQMFKLIEYARMLVGVKAIETLSTGYRNALAYAKQRVQGPDLADAAEKTAPRVEIIRHPDVRRMLMTQKAHVEGMRALLFYTASVQDEIMVAKAEAGRGEAEVASLSRLNDLLLPLVKGYGSEKSYELLAMSVQVLGGYGYIRDYPMEQYLRDAKIDTLYEGTTGIQGMDLFFRKIGKDRGATVGALLGQIHALAKGDAGDGALAAERELLAVALEDVRQTLATMAEFTGRSVHMTGLNTTGFLMSLAELVIGWLLLRQAEVAIEGLRHEPPPTDQAFYQGKVAAARWYARNVLPQLGARRQAIASTDLSLMELDDAAF